MWIVAWIALVVAVAAFARTRRLNAKLETLTQSYWDLRYEHSRLKAQVNRLDPELPQAEEPPPAAPTVGFVTLSSLKKPRE
jgi:hypothetical protein